MGSEATTVECEKQVRSWRLLRSVMQILIPTCNCFTIIENEDVNYSSAMRSMIMTGTIFGYRRGKVSLCIQANANSTNPILLLELAVPTSLLAKEMGGGSVRIALKSGNSGNTLLSTPLWTMYCNGRKVGYAVKRRPSNRDFEALRLMRSIVVGTGVINSVNHHQLMYLRANFQRVRASSNSQSFHLIDPDGDIHQELSIFFFMST
ncbi:hypothetical protein VNO77_00963 [Canavalia gladiata]|uniref:Protein MIZU-KUSSEI 1-like n=1 Tax=Canavalia gladiata TaxID=3824 RepID=A0AAN9MV23_CANGL